MMMYYKCGLMIDQGKARETQVTVKVQANSGTVRENLRKSLGNK